jgi:hypothetical protein
MLTDKRTAPDCIGNYDAKQTRCRICLWNLDCDEKPAEEGIQEGSMR